MKGLRSKIEIIVIGVFVLLFLIWAASKCSNTKEKAQEKAAIEAREDSLANAAQQQNTINTSAQPAPAAPNTSATPSSNNQSSATQTTATASNPQETQYTRLYVTIDKLKLRKEPGLKSDVLGELKLFDEVYYLNEETDSTFTLNLGKEIADEPYVKVKTKKGTVGWVYGAGVHYAKKKRSGVLE